MTLPLVVEMTVDTGNSYELSAETNQHEINLDNELEINVTSYDVPEYQGSYTVDAGLSPVVLNTQNKRLTQNVTVNALTENYISANQLSVNSSGNITSLVSVSAGYSPTVFAQMFTKQLDTQAGTTITPTTSEQTAVASGKYTTGVVKVGAIPSQYADITGVTANASDVLAGKYFVNNLGVLTLGTAIAGGGDGAPMPVDTVAEMIDTTKVYLYVGSEAGYTFGNWYYYNGSAWVSGGKWGADGGVNTNARNLLQYILERVAYTDTDMEQYVNALYEALAQAGSITTTYTITNALTHVINSNSAGGADSGDSYSATLTADTGYIIGAVTITMGGTDITSTAYTSATGEISIASVTGDIVITATATSSLLYSWDLTQSLTDTEQSLVATTTATQGATGLVFNTANTYCDFGAVYQKNRTYEIDIAEINTALGNTRRLLMADTDANTGSGGCGFLFMGAHGGWTIYNGGAWSSITGAPSNFDQATSISGKTLRVYVDTDDKWHFYIKTIGSSEGFVYAGVGASKMKTFTNGHIYIGGNTNDYVGNARFTGFRVYEGEIV